MNEKQKELLEALFALAEDNWTQFTFIYQERTGSDLSESDFSTLQSILESL